MIKEIDFSKHSSIKVGPLANVFVIQDKTYPKNTYILGQCNNVLIGPSHPPLMILGKKFDYIKIEANLLCVGAATPGGKLLSFCKKHDIRHFELLPKLPGNLGGMIKMNAGLKEYEIFNYLHSIETENGTLLKKDIPHGYRWTDFKGLVLEARFEIHKGFNEEHLEMFKKMRDNQPLEPSAGSCFKNPEGDSAGRLIEAVGLKGYRVGGMALSSKHANFLVNLDKGNFDEALELIQLAQKKVFEEFGVWLENEVIVVDERFKGESSPLNKPKS
ncbi:MAG: UDP-N-acetylenolpyruvoylglucosamine reductase [Arcobacter sp.]|nr:MAG: UDP-N-acetylenolpyruvoylglucosamine reductase [Arcobacter sp.]